MAEGVLMRVPQQLDRDVLNGMLHALPFHIFYFDRELVCRYAAPVGSYFLGRRAEDLPGRRVEELFPADTSLRFRLEAVLRTQQPCSIKYLPYPSGLNGTWPAGAWQVEMQPCVPGHWSSPASYQAYGTSVHRFPGEPAVLVTCVEKPRQEPAAPAIAEQIDKSTALLPRNLPAAAMPDGRRMAALVERIRTKLTVVRGFAQLLRRRQRRDFPDADVHELDRIGEAIRELDELLCQYEAGGRSPN